jgi:hypothetical protein
MTDAQRAILADLGAGQALICSSSGVWTLDGVPVTADDCYALWNAGMIALDRVESLAGHDYQKVYRATGKEVSYE